MRIATTRFLALGIVAMVATSAMAQQRGGPGGERGGRGGPGGTHPIVGAIDADGDHEISAEEIANAIVALKKLDSNKDGKLTRDEIQTGDRGGPGRGGPGGPGGDRAGRGGPGGDRAGRGGPDGPGRGGPGGDRGGRGGRGGPPNPEEFVEHALTFDADKNGQLNKDELSKMAEEVARRGPPGQGPEGRGGPGGRGGRPEGGDRPQRPSRPAAE